MSACAWRSNGRPVDGTMASLPAAGAPVRASDADDACDVCGSATVTWRKCKQICTSCGTILKSCADL